MDDLKLNKLFAGFLLAGLIVMTGFKLSEILVPHTELSENSYPIEVANIGSSVIKKMEKGPEPILALLSEGNLQRE